MTARALRKADLFRYSDLQSAYKETTVGFGLFFWLHQGRIPHRMCRFYWLLAGAVEERQGISIPYPSPTPLLTPGGIRCGGALLLPRAYRDLVSLYPVLSLLASSEFCSAICVRAGIARVSVGLPSLYRSFFIIGGKVVCSCGYVGFCFFFRRICADRGWIVCLGW